MTDAPKAGLTAADISSLLELFDASEWREMELRIGDDSLFVSKDGGRGASAGAAPKPAPASPRPDEQLPEETAAPAADEDIPAHWEAVTAPNVGTFYRAPKPGEAPYVEVGQSVTEDTEVCLVEVMKLFTPVTAGLRGTLRRICVEDGAMVEYGQPMLYIEPEQ